LFGVTIKRSKPLFWEYGRNTNSFSYPGIARNRSPTVAVRDGNWKLLVNVDGTGAELYDLGRDPEETRNIASDHGEVADRLKRAALDWRKSLR
jgi:arylsulfatase A-like enzyme